MKLIVLTSVLLIGSSDFGLASNPATHSIWDYFSLDSFYVAKAEALSSQIVNFNEPELMNRRPEILNQLAYWERRADSFNVSPCRLPAALLCLTDSTNEYNVIPGYYHICYEPNLALPYQIAITLSNVRRELSSQLSFLHLMPKDLPRPTTLLAILAMESWMMPDTIGDHGRSIGMCQLHAFTADYITSEAYKYHDIFRRYIVRNPKGSLTTFSFRGSNRIEAQQSMIDFLVRFLIVCKDYRSKNAGDGIRRYNGGGILAKNYAIEVIYRIASYDAFISRCPMPVGYDYRDLQSVIDSNLFFVSPSSGFSSEVLNLSEKKIYYAWAREQFSGFFEDFSPFPGFEGQTRFISYSGAQCGGGISHSAYILFDANRTLFSYFREELWEAVDYHNRHSPKKIVLFYYENGKRRDILSADDFKKAPKEIFSNPLANRQKIYIRPDSWVYMYDESGRPKRIQVYDDGPS